MPPEPGESARAKFGEFVVDAQESVREFPGCVGVDIAARGSWRILLG